MKSIFIGSTITLLMFAANAYASETSINDVQAKQLSDGRFDFSVTLSHTDKSWDHYANVWQIKTLDGRLLATRVLQHPHITEQPFTRSISGVDIPDGATAVIVVAGCTLDGINSAHYRFEFKADPS
ncbi:MAG: hypothetical protein OFPII_06270 [Osedax symbiont Rs1]|nr:MAG: hypothetical protein OFPII_06270 [Osedax symbiont Rs1]